MAPMPWLMDAHAQGAPPAPTLEIFPDDVAGDGALATVMVKADTSIDPDKLPKQVSLNNGVQAEQAGDSHTYVGLIYFSSSSDNIPPGAHRFTGSASKSAQPLELSDPVIGSQSTSFTWRPGTNLQVVTPSSAADRMVWEGETTKIQVKDPTLSPTGATNQACGTLEWTPEIRFSFDGGHTWSTPLTIASCKVLDKAQGHLEFSLSGITGGTDARPVQIAVQDPRAPGGIEQARILTYTYRSAAPGVEISLYNADGVRLIPGTHDLVGTGQYLLRVYDPSADINGTHQGKATGSLDKIEVALSTNVQTTTVVLTETAQDTGEYQAWLNVRTSVSNVANLVVVHSSGDKLTARYTPLHPATAPGTESEWNWISSAAASFTTTPPGSQIALFGTVSSGGAPTDFTQGALRIKGTAATDKVVVRTGALYPEECTAASMDTATKTADKHPGCLVLDLDGTGEGFVLLASPGEQAENVRDDLDKVCLNCVVLEVSHLTTFVVEYRDERGPADARDQLITIGANPWVWWKTHTGAVSLDGDSYYLDNTATVRLVDPDLTANTRTVNLVRQDSLTQPLVLDRQSAGVYEGTVTLSDNPNAFPVSNGQTFHVEYEDQRNSAGAAETISSSSAMVLDEPSGQITANQGVVSQGDDFTLTITDSNIPSDSPPRAEAIAPFPLDERDRIRFSQQSASTWTANVKSAYDASQVFTGTPQEQEGGAPSPPGVGRCWQSIDLGGPTEPYGLRVSDSSSTWTRITSPGESAQEYWVDYLSGRIIINNADPGVDVLPCDYRSIGTLTVEHTPAPTLTQSFIMDGTSDVLPLARHLDPVVPVGSLADPALVDGSGLPNWLGDTTPGLSGQPTVPHHFFFTGSTDCARIAVSSDDGSSISCSNSGTDSSTADVQLSRIPEAGTIVTVTYRVSATMNEPAISRTPLLPGTLKTQISGSFVPVDWAALIEAGNVDQNDIVDLVNDGKLPAGLSCNCLYRLDLYHDNRVGYGSLVDASLAPQMTFEYPDPEPAAGGADPLPVPVRVAIAPDGPASLDVLDTKGHPTKYLFGSTSTGIIDLAYPAGNLAPNAFDSTSVEITATQVSGAGLGSVLETETLTLTEDALSSGRFLGDLRFETNEGADNGRLFVSTADSVRLDIEHTASGKSLTAWFFRTSVANVQLTGSDFAGAKTVPLKVTDPDAGNLRVGWTFGWTESGNTQGVNLHPTVTPISTSSVIVHLCEDDDCIALTRDTGTSGSPSTNEFRVTSAGNITVTKASAFDADTIRADFRSIGNAQTDLMVELFTKQGDVVTTEHTLSKSGSSNVYSVADSFEDFADGETAGAFRFVYTDRVYASIGPQATGCQFERSNCPINGQRALADSDHVVETATWTAARAGEVRVDGTPAKVYGDSFVRVEVEDVDRNRDPLVAETLNAVLSRSDGAAATITLRQLRADGNVFATEVQPSKLLSGWKSGQTFDIRYNDPANKDGVPTVARYTTSSDKSAIEWISSDEASLSLGSSAAPEPIASRSPEITLSLVDIDFDETEAEPRFEIHEAELGQSHVFKSPDIITTPSHWSLGSWEEDEDQPGTFTATLTLKPGTQWNPDKRYHLVYKDPADSTGTPTMTSVSFVLVPQEVGVPTFGQQAYMEEDSLITARVPGGTAGSKVQIFYRPFDGEASQAWSSAGHLTLSGDTPQASFAIVETTGVTVLDIPFNSEIIAVYRDTSGDNGYWTTARSVIGVISDVVPTSEATVTSGQQGKREWYVTPPEIALDAVTNAGRLDFFEYRINGGAIQDCEAPCMVAIAQEGENLFEYRAVDISGAREFVEGEATFNQLVVRFDETAPSAVPTGLEAISRPDGEIEVRWNSTVDQDSPPTEFSEFVVFLENETEPIGNSTAPQFSYLARSDEAYVFVVAIEDAAGHMGDISQNVTGVADSVAPELDNFTVTPTELHEDQGDTTITATLKVVQSTLDDVERVFLRVADPFGETDEIEMLEDDDAPATWTLQYSSFNISGVYSVIGVAADKAGNEGTITIPMRYFAIDTEPPRIVNWPESLLQGDDLNVTVRDNDRGVASVAYTIQGESRVDVSVPSDPLDTDFCVLRPCDVDFQIPADRLELGENSITFELADANETANTASVTMTVTVLERDTPPETPTPPQIVGTPETLVEFGGRLSFRVTGGAITVLTFAVGDLIEERNVLNGLNTQTEIARVDVSGLPAGRHTATIRAENPLDSVEDQLTFHVLEEGVPLPPTQVTVTKDDKGRPVVSWQRNPDSQAELGGYLIHRAASPWRVIGIVDADTMSYTDLTALGKTTYEYAVTSYGTGGQGLLVKGDDSEESLPWFKGVQGTTFETDDIDPGIPPIVWWVALVVVAVLLVVGLLYANRNQVFGRKEEELYTEDYPDETETPFGEERHMVECPNCTTEFHVSGERPVVTNCPNCGRKGILR